MKLWVFHSQSCVSMKTGTDVQKAIDMAVVMCLSEKNALSAVKSISSHCRSGGGGEMQQEEER